MNILPTARGLRGGTTVLLAVLLASGHASAQSRLAKHGSYAETGSQDASYATHKQLTVSVTRFADARAALVAYIRRRAVRVEKQEETPEQLIAEFALPARDLPGLDSLTATLGYVLENNLNAHDLGSRAEELRAEEQQAVAQLAAEQQAPITPTNADQRRQETARAADRLTDLRKQLANISSRAGQAYVHLRLYDEVSFPTGNRRISFVNMPGVEYGYLRLDNPRVGLTSSAYRGYSLKYLVTRGKSYFNFGVYKPVGPKVAEENFINELLVINFGQDFYPRNFGRGRRRYFNLYTSYQVGGFLLSRNSDQGNQCIPNLNLGLGLELLKTRHVLLDTKASYFVPLHDRSRDLRGILGQASFSFVF